MTFTYTPVGTCSKEFKFEIDDNIIKSLEVKGGCNGNLKGISSLITGMKVEDVISRLNGITCGFKGTSCPDQISKALQSFLAHNK